MYEHGVHLSMAVPPPPPDDTIFLFWDNWDSIWVSFLQNSRCKLKYSLVNGEMKISLKGFKLLSYMSSKSSVNLFVWNHKFFGCPRKFSHRVMYIAPSSGYISSNVKMPFKLILGRFEVVFWCLQWECCTFWRIDGNSFKFTKTIYYGFDGHLISNYCMSATILAPSSGASAGTSAGTTFLFSSFASFDSSNSLHLAFRSSGKLCLDILCTQRKKWK